MRDSKLIVLISLALTFFLKSTFALYNQEHELLELSGYALIIICAFGRVYSSAFLGGFKNDVVVTDGPYSIVRNPLYLFSLIGITGISLISMHLVVIIFAPLAFLALYMTLISREEKFLLEKLGQPYADYLQSTPRLFPNLKLYKASETLPMRPQYLLKSIFDAVWWFLPIFVFEMVELF